MSNYMKIRKMDISNGPGCRVSIFLSGCYLHCPECFNAEAWDPAAGQPFTEETLSHLMELCGRDYIVGISILGGEPLWEGVNDKTTETILKTFKSLYPNKTAWVWTGRLYDEVKSLPLMQYIDTLVDGPFIKELANPKLEWKGSANQQVINL